MSPTCLRLYIHAVNIYPFICKRALHYFSGASLICLMELKFNVTFFSPRELRHVNLSLLGWQTSDPAGAEMVNLSQIHINIHQASPLMFQLQVCIHFSLCTSWIWAVWLVGRKDQGRVTDVSDKYSTRNPAGIRSDGKIKRFKTSHLRNRVALVRSPAFYDSPLISWSCWSVFNKDNERLSDVAVSEQQIRDGAGFPDTGGVCVAVANVSTSDWTSSPPHCCQIFLNASEGATGSLDFCHQCTWSINLVSWSHGWLLNLITLSFQGNYYFM